MGVELKIDPRNNSGGYGHALPANRITIGRYGGFKFGNAAELQRRHIFEKVRIDGDQREIAIMRDEQNFRRIFVRIPVALDGKIAAVAYNVRVGHDAVAVDHEPSADAAAEHSSVPRSPIIGRNFGDGDTDET